MYNVDLNIHEDEVIFKKFTYTEYSYMCLDSTPYGLCLLGVWTNTQSITKFSQHYDDEAI